MSRLKSASGSERDTIIAEISFGDHLSLTGSSNTSTVLQHDIEDTKKAIFQENEHGTTHYCSGKVQH